MIRYIAIAAALIAATPVTATPPSEEGWTLIDKGTTHDHWVRDRDWTAGRPGDTGALVWTWVDHKRSRTTSHDLILLEINCRAEGYRFAQAHSFDIRGKSSPLGTTEWEHAAPGTVIAEIVRVTCMEPAEAPQPQQTNRREFWR